MSFYKSQLKSWLAEKELKADRILSIGNMNDDKDYFSKVVVKEFKTVDINEKYNPDYSHDLNQMIIEGPLMNERQSFDSILAFELFEYLWNPYACFMNFNFLLKTGGELWLSVPFLYPTHNPSDQDYLRVTEWGIKKILAETGFEIVEFKHRVWKDATGWMNSVTTDGMRFAREYKHHNSTGFLIKAKKI